MQSRERIERDFREMRDEPAVLPKGHRPKLLSAGQAATLFELQVQMRAARRECDRILDKAGYSRHKQSRHRALYRNWQDRGRIDVLRPDKSAAKRRAARAN